MSRSNGGGAHRIGKQVMAHFQTEVPDPLTDDLPALLSPGGMAAPPIRILLAVFIGERRFKAAPMQIQGHHIRRRKGSLRQLGQEQFVDDPITFDAHPGLFRPCRMGCYHQATALAAWTHYHLWAVIEGALESALRAAELLIWGKREPKLDLGSRKQLVIFATHDEGQAR